MDPSKEPIEAFINYRREIDASDARLMHHFLRTELQGGNVFLDLRSLDAGIDFHDEIRKRIDRCHVFIVVIGPAWLDLKKNDVRRLDDDNDYVRREIEWAFEARKLTIPVLMPGASMPPKEALPDSIRALAGRQAEKFTHEKFEFDCRRLAERMVEAYREQAKRSVDIEIADLQRMLAEVDGQVQTRKLMQANLLSQLEALNRSIVGLEADRGRSQARLEKLKPGSAAVNSKWNPGSVMPNVPPQSGERPKMVPDAVAKPAVTTAPVAVSTVKAPVFAEEMIRFEPGVEVLSVFCVQSAAVEKLVIEIERPFAISNRLVTNGDWRRIVSGSGADVGLDADPQQPRTLVSYEEIERFLSSLNAMAGGGFYLLDEKEWLFAASRLANASVPGRPGGAVSTELWEWLADEWGEYAQKATPPEAALALHSGIYAWSRIEATSISAAYNLHNRRPWLTSFRASDLGFRVARKL